MRPLSLKTDVIKKRLVLCPFRTWRLVDADDKPLSRNRASGAPGTSARKGTMGLPKIASTTARPRSNSAAMISPLSRMGVSGGRVGIPNAGGNNVGGTAVKRQRRSSVAGLQKAE